MPVPELRIAVVLLARGSRPDLGSTLAALPPSVPLEGIYIVGREGGYQIAEARSLAAADPRIEVLAATERLGYGGAQKLAFAFADRCGVDIVAVLPNEAAGAAAALEELIEPFADPELAAVFGSRLLPASPRGGSFPMYKRVGNRWLTKLQNRLLGLSVSDLHSSCRLYRVSALHRLPYRYNSNRLHFDTELAIQLSAKQLPIVDVPIPGHAGGEISGLATIVHAAQSLVTVFRAKANRVYLVYHPRFDLEDDDSYVFKEAPTSLHQHILNRPFGAGSRVVELGAGHGEVSRELARRGVTPLAIDHRRPEVQFPFEYLELDLDEPFAHRIHDGFGTVDTVIALDVIEHLKQPEVSLRELHRTIRPGGRLIASTGNIAFLLQRLLLIVGEFNYGKKGILDLTHKRLFTIRSFRRTLEGEGFRVRSVRGFGPPIEDMVGKSWPLRTLDRLGGFLARVWPSMFGYQFLVEAERKETAEAIFARALADRGSSEQRRES